MKCTCKIEGITCCKTCKEDCPVHREEIMKYKIGMKVRKLKGYEFIGEVRAVFTTRKGEERLIIELVNECCGNGDRMLHVFNPDQVEPYLKEISNKVLDMHDKAFKDLAEYDKN